MSNTLPIHERFLTFQGEGVHAGRKAFFIRTMGCPVHCPWCDSAGTWHKDYVPKKINRMELQSLVDEVKAANPYCVVITGGEPCVHKALPEFTAMLTQAKQRVHVETCGGFLQPGDAFDWITISPKRAHLPLRTMLLEAHELKIIVDTPTAIEEWVETLTEIAGYSISSVPYEAIWLHPEWSQRNNPEILDAITKAVVERGGMFRAGWQMHKLYKADTLDPRSAPTVPLGGNPSLGSPV